MDTLSAIVEILKELGTPAITVIGFAWVIFKLNAFKTDLSGLRTELKTDISGLRAELKADISGLRAELKTDISELRTELKADISELKADVSELKVDVRSIKNNHLPHIEAAITELAKGTPNEAHVKAILELSHKADLE
jgi:hypothetical protein